LSPIIHLHNLSYAYPPVRPSQSPLWALQDINLTIQAGEFVALMGPTGAGKSTLCLALNGLVPQLTGGLIQGEVVVAGLNTRRHKVAELARHVALVFQEPETQLFNMTVAAELAFGLESLGVSRPEMIERTAWALASVGLTGYDDRSPHHLSGGQKQRVAIAAALAMLPAVLVLDEPTASLDPLGKQELLAVLRQLRRQQGMTIVMVEQESEWIAEFAERVVVLQDGRVALDDSPAAIFEQIEPLRQLGLAAPQVSEVAHCLNQRLGTHYRFTRLAEAVAGLEAGGR
jgi:energy-coupling factor transporter ATP-binding protein EcfA2